MLGAPARLASSVVLLALLLGSVADAGTPAEGKFAFDAVVLGASGGLDESDLTSVLVGRAGSGRYLALDAGTLWVGLSRALAAGSLEPPPPPSPSPSMGAPAAAPALSPLARALREQVTAVFLSHPHLDHVSGLAIASPEDAPGKSLYGLPATLDALRDHLFNGRLWANFTDEGPGALKRYHLARLTPGTPVEVAGAELTVEAIPLSHGGMDSTAFLVSAGPDALVYLGDTGPDAVEKQGRLAALWDRLAPLVRARRLRALFLECSFADPRPEAQLFGHLTPQWIVRELDALAARVEAKGGAQPLRGLSLVITHIKPSPLPGVDVRAEVARQLAPLATRGIRVIVPHSSERLRL